MNPNSFFCIILAVEPLTPPPLLTPFQLQIKCILSIILIMYKLYMIILWNLMYILTMSLNTSETKFTALIQWHLWCHTNRHEEVALPLTTSPCPSAPVSFRGSPTPKWSSYSNRLWTYSKKSGCTYNVKHSTLYKLLLWNRFWKCMWAVHLFFWDTHQKLHGARFQTASSLWSVS